MRNGIPRHSTDRKNHLRRLWARLSAVVASDPCLPFGGTSRSGHGRGPAAAGIREFTNTRTDWVAH